MGKFYKKRAGTSGISGHLYETKLIALILYRLTHDDCIEDFCLVSNMDEIGAFDDICIKIKIKGYDRPVAIFIQVKHKENDDKFPTFDNKNESVKWFESLSKIKKKITVNRSQDQFFNADIAESDCVFILYTNARCDFDSNTPYLSDYDITLNKLLATSSTVGTLPLYNEQHVEAFGEIILKEDINVLVEHFAKYLNDKTNRSLNMMNDECIHQYHAILKFKVVDITEIQTDDQKPDVKWRTLTFRDDFFANNDKYIVLFRDQLFKEILKNHPKIRMEGVSDNKQSQDLSAQEASVDDLISSFLSNPSVASLTPLIITQIASNGNGKLEFLFKRPFHDIEQLRLMNIPQGIIDEALSAATATATRFLRSLTLKVPITFGNVDLAISGNPKKIAKRLNYLTSTIVDLCKLYEPKGSYKVVRIDDTIDGGILSSNGGLASAVGNILAYDEQTEMLRFSKDYTPAQSNAKDLFIKLSREIDNLHEYRFVIKTMKFPKVKFDCRDVARGFFRKFVIFAKQSNHSEVEEILKIDIEKQLNMSSHNYSISPDSVFLYYHNEIQKWWMSPKTGTYLTKATKLDQEAINNIVMEPQISALQIMFHMNHLKYFGYSFNEDATKWLELSTLPSKTCVATDTVALTTVKVIQCLRNYYLINNYAVLDLKCLFDLSTDVFSSLGKELKNTKKTIIILWNTLLNNSIQHIRLYELVQATQQTQLFVVTNSQLIKILYDFFPCTNVLHDQTQSLAALTLESQRELIKDAKVLFQGQEVSLSLFVDDVSMEYIKGEVLDKVIRNEFIIIGTSLSNTKYEEIKHLYIDRRISEFNEASDDTHPNSYLVRTFQDIDADAVLVTAVPGMGKSTLLTHLSLNTKERDKRIWIVRINLLDHSKQFYKWQADKTVLDILEILNFLCRVVTRSNDVSIYLKDDNVYLERASGDDLAHFELNIFLHFYNERKLIFLFDGFDEICPHYKSTVINFLHIVRDHPQKNKIWVASRPYSDIVPDLQKVLGRCFKIEHLSISEQESYLDRAWQERLIFEKLNDIQEKNLKSFVSDISRTMSTGIYYMDTLHIWIRRVFLHFYEFAYSHIGFNGLSQETLVMAKTNSGVTEDVDALAGTPLLLYFIADYIVNVTDKYEPRGDGQVYINILQIYEMFVENKLKKVIFQDKNKMDIYNPDIIMKFEKELADCMSLHKRIAANALLDKTVYSGPNGEEFKDLNPYFNDLDDVINKMKVGADKTGLVSHFTLDNVPVFIHRTFAEYFAAEYICDVLKNENIKFETKRNWLNAVSECCSEDVFIWVRFKSKLDRELTQIIRNIDNTESFILSLI
ncbi:unnamed protein product [Arctia plantaginis]|uniref:NACHT domain-containing protein n=1 Tax=Arctia plantaginis TaxID=874455 RepID=A0A8S1AJY1_ARCPL|nr:unnamed protein product [Arctia plantaginis]